MYDIAIIGAGPAGATLARRLGSQYRVLLVDRRRMDLDPAESPISKLCGGLLAPAAQRELARQGLGIPQAVIAGPQLFAVRTLDLAADLERLYQRFYVNVDREAFDRWLVSLVPESVERCWGWSLSAIETDDEAPTLTFRTAEGGRASVRARRCPPRLQPWYWNRTAPLPSVLTNPEPRRNRSRQRRATPHAPRQCRRYAHRPETCASRSAVTAPRGIPRQ